MHLTLQLQHMYHLRQRRGDRTRKASGYKHGASPRRLGVYIVAPIQMVQTVLPQSEIQCPDNSTRDKRRPNSTVQSPYPASNTFLELGLPRPSHLQNDLARIKRLANHDTSHPGDAARVKRIGA
mgnify:CR=1 FL=1